MRYLDNIIARFKRQEAKGLAKYGQALENNQANIEERLEHLAQELTDALMYIEWVKEQIGGRPTTQMKNVKRRGYYDG